MSMPDADGNEAVRSVGDGIEREVFHALMEGYRRESARWMTSRSDGFSTVATSHTYASARYISAARIESMAIFGAITAMCLIRGVSAHPLSPAFLHYLIHDCDLHSIHQQLLAEWHPTLKMTISNWINIGHLGDASTAEFRAHFFAYHDGQVSFEQFTDEILLIYIYG
jgi:hypothetical protein